MKIQRPDNTLTFLARLSGLNIKTSFLRPNQQLLAEVISRLDNGEHLLKIGTQQLSTRLDHTLEPGQKLLIEILTLEDPTQVRIIAETKNPSHQHAPLQLLLRQLLPIQTSATALFQLVNSNKNSPLWQALGPSIKAQVKSLESNIVNWQNLNVGDTFKTSVNNSGLFFERKLLNAAQQGAQPALQADFKASLFRLHAVLARALGDLPSDTNKTSAYKANGSDQYQLNSSTLTYNAPSKTATTSQAMTLQNYRAAATSIPLPNQKPTSDSEHALTTLAEQIKTGESLKANSNPDNLARLLNELTKLNLDKQQLLDFSPPLRNLFPQINSHVTQVPQHLDSSEALLRFLLRHVEGSLARTQVAQISSSPQENDTKTPYLFEIPIRRNDEITVFQFRIDPEHEQSEQQNGKQGQKQWAVSMAFQLSGIGPVYVKLTLCGEKISTHFWLEQDQTYSLFKKSMQDLQNQFEKEGLNVQQLLCHLGLPQLDIVDNPFNEILDEQA